MNTKTIFLVVLLLLLPMTTSCGAVMGTPPPGGTNTPLVDAEATIAQAVAETLAAETQFALSVAQTLEALHSSTPLPSPTSSITPSPSATPIPTGTSVPVFPTLTVSAETNCRSGPSQSYDLLGTLHPGETTEVIGRTTVENYWLVRNPDSPTQICWLWGQYATVTGWWQALPVATQPPTPTPAAGFTVTYLGLVPCAPSFALRLQIKNIGKI